MRIPFQALIILLLFGSGQLSLAQDEFYNRDSSGYTYRIGPVLPKIQQDWQLDTLGRDFTFGFNPSGVNIENYVLSLLNLPDVTTALQASTATDVFNYLLLQSFQSPTEASVLSNATSMMNQKLTIRMLQDVLRRLQLGPDPAASIQAGAQEKCVQLAASLGLISVESAEKLCSGGLGGASRGIMIFGTPSIGSVWHGVHGWSIRGLCITSLPGAINVKGYIAMMERYKGYSISGSALPFAR